MLGPCCYLTCQTSMLLLTFSLHLGTSVKLRHLWKSMTEDCFRLTSGSQLLIFLFLFHMLSFYFIYLFLNGNFCSFLSDIYWNQRPLNCSPSMLTCQTSMLLPMLSLHLRSSTVIWKFYPLNPKFLLFLGIYVPEEMLDRICLLNMKWWFLNSSLPIMKRLARSFFFCCIFSSYPVILPPNIARDDNDLGLEQIGIILSSARLFIKQEIQTWARSSYQLRMRLSPGSTPDGHKHFRIWAQ